MDIQVGVGTAGCALSTLAIQPSPGMGGLLPAESCLPAGYPTISPTPETLQQPQGWVLFVARKVTWEQPKRLLSLSPAHLCCVQAPPCVTKGREHIPLNICQDKEEIFLLSFSPQGWSAGGLGWASRGVMTTEVLLFWAWCFQTEPWRAVSPAPLTPTAAQGLCWEHPCLQNHPQIPKTPARLQRNIWGQRLGGEEVVAEVAVTSVTWLSNGKLRVGDGEEWPYFG